MKCLRCKGTGEEPTGNLACSKCRGTGAVDNHGNPALLDRDYASAPRRLRYLLECGRVQDAVAEGLIEDANGR